MTSRDIADDILKIMKQEFWPEKQMKWDMVKSESDKNYWTPEIKKFFKKVGDHLGYVTLASGLEEGSWEYLLDVVIVKRQGKNWQDQRGIVIAIESEWSTKPGDVHYDFMKLSDIKADLRVMVYTDIQSQGEENWSKRKIIPLLCEISNNHLHRQADDAYLGIGIPDFQSSNSPKPKAFFWTADGSAVEEINFDKW